MEEYRWTALPTRHCFLNSTPSGSATCIETTPPAAPRAKVTTVSPMMSSFSVKVSW